MARKRTTRKPRRSTARQKPAAKMRAKGRFDREVEAVLDHMSPQMREEISLNMGPWQSMRDVPARYRTAIETARKRKK
jgi:hypothetical protein